MCIDCYRSRCRRRCGRGYADNHTDDIAYMRTRRVLVNDLDERNNDGCCCNCGCCCGDDTDTAFNNLGRAYDYRREYDYPCGCEHAGTGVIEDSVLRADLFNNCETCR